MVVEVVSSQRVAFTPAHIQLACDGTFLALPKTRTDIGAWSLHDISCKPLELVGHGKTLTALALGNKSSPKLLVSAADDYVIVWDLHQCRQKVERGESVRGRVIGTTLGTVAHLALSPDDSRIAACVGAEIVILLAQRECSVAVLEGHDGAVTAAEFCPHYTATLVTISEDRTFKVWDVSELVLVYQSPILTASPFLCLTMSFTEPRVSIGAADGMVRVIDLTDGNGFRCLHQVDAEKIINRQREHRHITHEQDTTGPVKVSSRPVWRQPVQAGVGAGGEESPRVEAGTAVLAMYFSAPPMQPCPPSTNTTHLPFLHNQSSIVSDLLTSSPLLLVGTTAGFLVLNAGSLDLLEHIDFQEPLQHPDSIETNAKVLNAAGSIIFGQGADQMLWCVVGSPFENVVHILKWKQSSPGRDTSPRPQSCDRDGARGDIHGITSMNSPNSLSASKQSIEITVLSTASLLEDSPLRADMTPKQKDNKDKKPRDFVSHQKKGVITGNQPLTFKTKIKSSGYTAQPRTTMFKPQTSFSAKSSRTPPKSNAKQRVAGEYPMQANPPQHLNMKTDVAERPTPVNALAISDGGQSLACALANKSALIFPIPMSNKKASSSSSYTGHNHVVSSVSWSHCGSRLITASSDRTACVWLWSQSEPALTFDRQIKSNAPVHKENPAFSKEIQSAQFYFMDKFILMCSGNTLFLYKYYIDPTKDDVQRYLVQSRYKVVQQWTAESQAITALAAINSFLSYVVLCGCSNKNIEVFDLNAGRQIRKMTDTHARPLHALCQNEGSQFASHPSGAYDLFASAAAGDCIKLWDLRTDRCVRRYEGHLNRVHPCGLAFSPCGRFLATGSEDKCSYLFDLRSGTYLHKLQGHTDVVSDVAFNPRTPQLFTASLDGKIAVYNNR
ncbi:WD repeat-containing protein 27-like [Mya arenaria]|uniref:WD repeat-containing protein 27-like n=1 Tax=Mya arenaria TaxID=6604 RepID=UPI0022E9281A|nr:WD repeat-containing protein 27-like [Mya arenaria]XP_052766911.1 WD repeat-containing protein 27-like [Mya arenaria]